MARAAHAALRAQLVQQLFFQHSAGLNEQAAVDGFVGHAQALVIRILGLQPSGNLLGRPVQDQFTRNDVPQLAVAGKEALLRSQGRVPSSTIRIKGAIGRTATMARNLPAHGGGRAIQSSGYLPKRRIGSDSSGDAPPRRGGDPQPRTATSSGRNAAARQQHRANAAMWLVKGAPNLMQRLSRLPPAPHAPLLDPE